MSAMSFSDKYRIWNISSPDKSQLLNLVLDGIIPEDLFGKFRENYRNLSEYVHHRITYELAHILPKLFPSTQHYAQALKLATTRSKEARIVKATLLKYLIIVRQADYAKDNICRL